MEITINGNVTINANKNATGNRTKAEETSPLLDRTNEVLIDNATSFYELIEILRKKPEAVDAARVEAEEKEREAKEAKMRRIFGEEYEAVVGVTDHTNGMPEKEKRRPGAIQLRNYEPRIARIELSEDGVCEVFSNGYAIYDNGDRKTVLWVPDCGSATYYFTPLRDNEKQYQKQRDDLGEDVLGPLPWYNALLLAGEDQIWVNMDHPKSVGTASDADANDPEVKPSYRWVCGTHFDNPEEAYLKKEAAEERRKALTEKQREAYEMYYEQGLTQQEIADILGVHRTTVQERLEGARDRFKQDKEKFFSE